MKKIEVDFSNPAMVYAIIWLSLIWLTFLQMTTNLCSMNLDTVLLVLFNVASFVVIAVLCRKNIEKKAVLISKTHVDKLIRFSTKLLIIWAVGTTFEICYAKGVPLLWAFNGDPRNYTDFGIHSFHGFMNSLYLFSETALYFSYQMTKNRRYLYIFIGLLVWPIIIIKRGILLSALFQTLAIYLLMRKLTLKQLVNISAITLIMIVLFGIMGDLRTTYNYQYLVSEDSTAVFKFLPSGFLWTYVYITSPINNVVANIATLTPLNMPYHTVIHLLPTVIRNAVITDVKFDTLKLVDTNLNVSTIYASYLSDFGVIGAAVSIVIIQLIIYLFYIRAKRGEIWAIMGYTVFFQGIINSVFYDLILHLVYIGEVVLAMLFLYTMERKIKRKETIC